MAALTGCATDAKKGGRPCRPPTLRRFRAPSPEPRGPQAKLLPVHAHAEANDARRDDAADVVRVARRRTHARRRVVRIHEPATRLNRVGVSDVEDLDARDQTERAEREHLVDAEVGDEDVLETPLAEWFQQDVHGAEAVAAV